MSCLRACHLFTLDYLINVIVFIFQLYSPIILNIIKFSHVFLVIHVQIKTKSASFWSICIGVTPLSLYLALSER